MPALLFINFVRVKYVVLIMRIDIESVFEDLADSTQKLVYGDYQYVPSERIWALLFGNLQICMEIRITGWRFRVPRRTHACLGHMVLWYGDGVHCSVGWMMKLMCLV
jgi:hypothetical protein